MAQTKNLCAQIHATLHAYVCKTREQSGMFFAVDPHHSLSSAHTLRCRPNSSPASSGVLPVSLR